MLKVGAGVDQYSTLTEEEKKLGWNVTAHDRYWKEWYMQVHNAEHVPAFDLPGWPKNVTNPFHSHSIPDKTRFKKNIKDLHKMNSDIFLASPTPNAPSVDQAPAPSVPAANSTSIELDNSDFDFGDDDAFASSDDSDDNDGSSSACALANGTFSLQAAYKVKNSRGTEDRLTVISVAPSGWFASKSSDLGAWHELSSDGKTMTFMYPYDCHFLGQRNLWKHLVKPSGKSKSEMKDIIKHLTQEYSYGSNAMIALDEAVATQGLGGSHVPAYKVEVPLEVQCERIVPLAGFTSPSAQVSLRFDC